MLRLVRMEELAGRATSQLSGGQQQRVALARALAPHPEVLLLDEPLSALDLKLRKAMQIELKRLQRDTGITFVFVTHDQEEALTMSDRIAVMSQGKVRQVGSPREIYDHPAERFVADFIGEANMLKGELVRVEGDRGLVRLADGIEVPARVPEGAPRERRGHRGRPAGARCACATSAAARGLPAVVENAVFVGTDTQYHLRLAGGEPFVVRRQNTSADVAPLQDRRPAAACCSASMPSRCCAIDGRPPLARRRGAQPLAAAGAGTAGPGRRRGRARWRSWWSTRS